MLPRVRALTFVRGIPPFASAVAVAALAAVLACGAAGALAGHPAGGTTEVVVTLRSPAAAFSPDRARATTVIAREQAAFVSALRKRDPRAVVRWRYRTVLNGVAVVVRRDAVDALRRLPGVRSVDLPARYRTTARQGPREIGAPALWGRALENQGQGTKIAIIDDGVDQTHPYFDPRGYEMPVGFPKGQRQYTTAKVIVARSFPPPGSTWKSAGKPFDPDNSDHATHVAGIAAGNAGTKASGAAVVSGVAPKAYIGNYRALTVPTASGVGLNGNAPELVAAIEAAVNDGMDVINLSVGEFEIEPSRDLVALALDAAAAAGVVPVVAAGNDHATYGGGSVTSPGTSPAAITVAATSNEGPGATPEIAGYSAAGPSALSLRLKPDLAAPGSGILSSGPRGEWRTLSGTSMAAPHVAGAAALLRQRHPAWTVAEIKAAMVVTARPAGLPEGGEAPPTRAGAGAVDLAAAVEPLLFTSPTGVSFGLLRPGATLSETVTLLDAGGGGGAWNVTVQPVGAANGATVTAPAQVSVPGLLSLTLSTAGAAAGEVGGVVRLERGGVVRRVPYWGRVIQPALTGASPTRLPGPGLYSGDTRGGRSAVDRYVYPELPPNGAVSSVLRGPEQVFRVTLSSPAANFGVVVVSRTKGTTVEPRIVAAGNESRLMGFAALPVIGNPYLAGYEGPTLASGVLSPLTGAYDVVFDSRRPAGAGAFTFRLWVNDVLPPTVTIPRRTVARDTPLEVSVVDTGSGVDPTSITARIDGVPRTARLRKDGRLRVPTLGLAAGAHTLRLQVSDYQETRNNENVARVLPNTRVVVTRIVVG